MTENTITAIKQIKLRGTLSVEDVSQIQKEIPNIWDILRTTPSEVSNSSISADRLNNISLPDEQPE